MADSTGDGIYSEARCLQRFCGLQHRRRTCLSRLLLLLGAVAITANLGCGTGKQTTNDSGSVIDPGTPLGTQTFTITTAGSDGVNTVRHTDQYQVTIQ